MGTARFSFVATALGGQLRTCPRYSRLGILKRSKGEASRSTFVGVGNSTDYVVSVASVLLVHVLEKLADSADLREMTLILPIDRI